jgi:chromosomal replication initiation ATPase DnaA
MKFKHTDFHKAVATARELAGTLAQARGYTIDDVIRQNRKRPLPQIRWEVWYTCKHDLGLGRTAIGKIFNRDPQTIYHGIKAQAKKLERAKRLQAMSAAYPQAVVSPGPTA